jgi:phosphohistidine phosphatase
MAARLELYIVRHGIAEDRAADGTDASRALTDEGVERLREVAEGLDALEIRWDVVLTSSLLRARQTADVLIKAMKTNRGQPKLAVTSALVPEASPGAILAELRNYPDATSIALVSHEPLVSTLTANLLGSAVPLPFKKGGVCRIDFDEPPPYGTGLLRWFAPPKVLRHLDSR